MSQPPSAPGGGNQHLQQQHQSAMMSLQQQRASNPNVNAEIAAALYYSSMMQAQQAQAAALREEVSAVGHIRSPFLQQPSSGGAALGGSQSAAVAAAMSNSLLAATSRAAGGGGGIGVDQFSQQLAAAAAAGRPFRGILGSPAAVSGVGGRPTSSSSGQGMSVAAPHYQQQSVLSGVEPNLGGPSSMLGSVGGGFQHLFNPGTNPLLGPGGPNLGALGISGLDGGKIVSSIHGSAAPQHQQSYFHPQQHQQQSFSSNLHHQLPGGGSTVGGAALPPAGSVGSGQIGLIQPSSIMSCSSLGLGAQNLAQSVNSVVAAAAANLRLSQAQISQLPVSSLTSLALFGQQQGLGGGQGGAIGYPSQMGGNLLPGSPQGQVLGSPTSAGNNGPKLEVKDALTYLDKVKNEFGNQPHIYNKFLDIMKDFKSQAIDTPGVIQRVSSLFRGYPSLIVGFNTFLPSGYRIEMIPDDPESRVSISTPSGRSHIITSDGEVIHRFTGIPLPGPSVAQHGGSFAGPVSSSGSASGLTRLSSPLNSNFLTGGAGAASDHQGGRGMLAGAPQPPSHYQSPSLSSASSGPPTFSQPHSSIQMLSQNPPVVSAGAMAAQILQQRMVEHQHQLHQQAQQQLAAQQQQGSMGIGGTTMSRHNQPPSSISHGAFPTQLGGDGRGVSTMAGILAAVGGAGGLQGSVFQNTGHVTPSQAMAGQQEFTHAIGYVNRIKTRFCNKPDVYKQFLEILHTYQKQQKQIKETGGGFAARALSESEVYKHVSKLFQGSEDLLREFSQFLPDAATGMGGGMTALGCAKEALEMQIQQQQQHLELQQQFQTFSAASGQSSAAGNAAAAGQGLGVGSLPSVGDISSGNESSGNVATTAIAQQQHGMASASFKPKVGNNPLSPSAMTQIATSWVESMAAKVAAISMMKVEAALGNDGAGSANSSPSHHASLHGDTMSMNSNLFQPPPSVDATRPLPAFSLAQSPKMGKDVPPVFGSPISTRPANEIGGMGVIVPMPAPAAMMEIQDGGEIAAVGVEPSRPGSRVESDATDDEKETKGDVSVITSSKLKSPASSVGKVSTVEAVGVKKRSLSGVGTSTSSANNAPGVSQSKETEEEVLVKKPKLGPVRYDVSYAEASKHGTLSEFQFFDKVRRALKNDEVYENFLRCLVLFNKDLISKSELIQLITPFLIKSPELMKWMRTFLGCPESSGFVDHFSHRAIAPQITSDLALEIDYATCKQYGASYRALPASYKQPSCSGRTKLCDEVLNDTWVSFPSWSSEDTTTVSAKKTQYEEYIYRAEDERFELDIVIEINRATIHILEAVRQQLELKPAAEQAKFVLDDTLGGRSTVLHQKAIKRIYGDKAPDVIDGLKRNPVVALPVVIRRLKAKDEEWREAQKGFNKLWRDQLDRYYLKSLDHQSLTFKQSDMKLIRSKALVSQIETLFYERNEHVEEGAGDVISGPHLAMIYPEDPAVFYDTADLLIHHVKRQPSLNHDDKAGIKLLLRRTLPDLFGKERSELSDDEDDQDDDVSSVSSASTLASQSTRAATKCRKIQKKKEQRRAIRKKENECLKLEPTCGYALLFLPEPWYVFIRLHALLCERLAKLKKCGELAAAQETARRNKLAQSVAEKLKLVQLNAKSQPAEYFNSLMKHIKDLLDGQIDANTFEDGLREMFTIHAYLMFTVDKIISTMVKELQHMVTDETCLESMKLYETWQSKGGAGGVIPRTCNTEAQRFLAEQEYQRAAETLMADINCFKMFFLHESSRICVELLDTETDDAGSVDQQPTGNAKSGSTSTVTENRSSDKMDTDEPDRSQITPLDQLATCEGGAGVKLEGSASDARSSTEYVQQFLSTHPNVKESIDSIRSRDKRVFMLRNLLSGLTNTGVEELVPDESIKEIRSGYSGTKVEFRLEPLEETPDSFEDGQVEKLNIKNGKMGDVDDQSSSKIVDAAGGEPGLPRSTDSERDAEKIDPIADDKIAVKVVDEKVTENAQICESSIRPPTQHPQPFTYGLLETRTPEKLFVLDQEEAVFSLLTRTKIRQVAGTGMVLYRWKSLHLARQNHRSVTESRYQRYSSWLEKWASISVSSSSSKAVSDWLVSGLEDNAPSNLNQSETICGSSIVSNCQPETCSGDPLSYQNQDTRENRSAVNSDKLIVTFPLARMSRVEAAEDSTKPPYHVYFKYTLSTGDVRSATVSPLPGEEDKICELETEN